MNKSILAIIFFCLFGNIHAQNHEIGISAGANNVVGDVRGDAFYSNLSYSFGALYKRNFAKTHSMRVAISYNDLSGNGTFPYGYDNSLSFSNNLISADWIWEWNFTDYIAGFYGKSAPFVFVGLGVQSINLDVSKIDFNIPFGIGYKMLISPKFIISTEVTVRYTMSDELDMLDGGKIVGNLGDNDWLTFLGVTLTYTFGKDPCPCGQ
jgi:hypothetical protein